MNVRTMSQKWSGCGNNVHKCENEGKWGVNCNNEQCVLWTRGRNHHWPKGYPISCHQGKVAGPSNAVLGADP